MNHDQSSLTSFLEQAKEAGEYLQIDKEVDVATQVAALCSETTKPTLFTNLKDYEGFQLVDCLTRFRPTQAMALGLNMDDPSSVIPGYLQKLMAGPGPTVDVDDAPIKEVIWTGKDADLTRLPVPTPSEGADFPHLGLTKDQFQFPVISSGMGVTRHPDGQLNTFFTMAKIVGPNRIHFFLLPGHTKANVDAWAAKGEKCSMALVIGCHPVYEIGACYTGPHEGFSELNIISALLGGAPVPLIKAETLDLQIPAMAEIVIEGFIDPELQPYLHASSHSDSYAPIISMEPFFDVTAITMRKRPIYRHIQPNRFTEHHSLAEFMSVPPLLMTLMGEGLPVKDIHMPLTSCGNCAIIQMSPINQAQVDKAMQIATSDPFVQRLTIVVDEDVDIYNLNDVLFAVSIRTNGLDDTLGNLAGRGFPEPLSVRVESLDDVTPVQGKRWAIDATKPAPDDTAGHAIHTRLQARGEGRVKLADFL